MTNNDQTFSEFFSIGAIWRILPFMRLGAYYAFSNADSSPALTTFKLGEAWAIPLFEKSTSLLLLDFSLPPNGVYLIEAGFEQPVLSNFFARIGFRQELKDNQIQGFRGFTAGLGVNLVGFDLDYSYIPDGNLGYSQNLGLTYHFPVDKPKKPVPQAAPNPALTFKPPSEITAADKVVRVEVHFDLPQNENPRTPSVISPQLQQAIDQAGQKVQVNPGDAVAWVALGNLYWQAGQADFTLQSFEEALRLNPSNTQLKAWIDQYHRLNPASKITP
jgi:tetratricopeptide (TPR) repeat protein